MNLSRRNFLRTSGAVTLGFVGLRNLLGRGVALAADGGASPLGPLVADPRGVLNLPSGFAYNVFSKNGERMDDGFFVPGNHDGMAAFPGPNGKTILVRNHEIGHLPARIGPFGRNNELLTKINPSFLYDRAFSKDPPLGGTTTLVYDTARRRLDSHYLSLVGTLTNCAGGPTPWNTWLSCEESDQTAGEVFENDHGYVFEVPARAKIGLTRPRPIKPMGRFVHEAVAVDPRTNIVYLTEDRSDGLIYRFIPDHPPRLIEGGKLQGLKVKDQPSLDLTNWIDANGKRIGLKIPVGQPMAVEWIDLDEIQSPKGDLRLRGFAQGAARFTRGEGMWFGRRSIFFACTDGGVKRKGQIWRYVPSRWEGQAEEQNKPGTVELFIEPNNKELLENADNVTVAPWGDLVLCEDGPNEQFLIGVTPKGELYRIAQNIRSESEFAGSTFSPDGSTLFVNIQHSGVTIAITGPWPRA